MIKATDGSLYTGITTDVQRRWKQHCGIISGGAKYFRSRKPKQLVYIEAGHDRSSASKRESAIKQLSRLRKEALLFSTDNQLPVLCEENGLPDAAVNGIANAIEPYPSKLIQ